MIAQMVQDFAIEIEKILQRENILLPTPDGHMRQPAIYAHSLPAANKQNPPLAPWVLVSLYNGEQPSADQPQTATLHITDLVVDANEDMQGSCDALQLLETIGSNLYSRSFVADKYEVIYPYQFALLDDVRYPHFAAGLAIKVEMPGFTPQNAVGGNSYV